MSEGRSVAGRPRRYSPAAFRRGVNKYFASISRIKTLKEKVWDGTDENGKDIYHWETIKNALDEDATAVEYLQKPSIAGLCSFLHMHRDTFNEYSRHEDYADICAAAKNEIESYLCSQLGSGKGDSGIIFNLTHNYGWKSKVEIEAGAETRKSLSAVPMTTDEKISWLLAHGYSIPGIEQGGEDGG